MNENFICPYCGAINRQCYDDCMDEEEYNGKLYKKYYGYCADCETNLIWWEEYRLVGYDEIKIM